jgi:CRP-like cAMP-binding protein
MANDTGNQILDRLPREEVDRLLPSSKIVSLPRGKVVFRQDGPMPYVYFPTSSVLGIVTVASPGKQVEGTTVGPSGILGIPVFLGVDFHPFMAIVQLSGNAWRMPADRFLQAARQGSMLDRLVRRYTVYRLGYGNQMAACNTLHGAEERLARWILMGVDYLGKDEFDVSHEFLSELLGVRRQTISIAAAALQHAGFITYSRGVLRVLDREGLESASCECYTILKELYVRIMR